METIITTLINGLSLGAVYALIALGYTMVYGIAKMLNFAHGDVIMIGGYIIFLFFFNLKWNPIAAILVAIVVCAVFGFIMEKLAYKPLRGASPLAVLITAIGVSTFLQSLAQIIFGANSKVVILGSNWGFVKLGSVSIPKTSVLTLVASTIIMVALTLFIKFSKTGRAMIAVSEDRGAAQLMGVNVNKIISITFLIGAALAGVASAFYLMKSSIIMPTTGSMPGIKAFTAAVIGGIGSIPGAMLGGILLGLLECIFTAIPALSPYTIALEFAILIILLLVRPNGILGKKRREKV